MDDRAYRQNTTIQYCFPYNNASCKRDAIEGPGYFFLCFFLSCITVCTVFLNLLVIISISHFKQLHTPTNLIILSLAVADFLMGVFTMPVDLSTLMDTCWYLGKMACYIFQIICFVSKYGSLYSVVLIAVDRYIAITNPLKYSTQLTLHKTLLCIILGWFFCLCYIIVYLYYNDNFLESNIRCYGECLLVINDYGLIIDFVIAFLAPCSFILVLYFIIFKVAIHQAKAIRAEKISASNNHGAKLSRSSEINASKKLGTVVFVYLVCWIPYYICSVSIYAPFTVWYVLAWLIDLNSFLNPLIYSIFYSWFRESAKYIVTCRIFESSSLRLNLFSEH